MHLVQLFLPLYDGAGGQIDVSQFAAVRKELTEQFGGVTAHMRAPASGLWKDEHGAIERDDVVTFEVVLDGFDRVWWTDYRRTLEARFGQTSIHGRVLTIALL
jgi:hypothetical protein